MNNQQVVIRWEMNNGTEQKVLDVFVKSIYEAMNLNSDNYEGLEAFRKELVWMRLNVDGLLSELYIKKAEGGL